MFFTFLGLLYAFIFGQVTSIIQQLQKPNSDFHQKLDSIKKFTRLYTVPEEIGGRLIDYFRTTWTTNKGLDVDEVNSFEYLKVMDKNFLRLTKLLHINIYQQLRFEGHFVQFSRVSLHFGNAFCRLC